MLKEEKEWWLRKKSAKKFARVLRKRMTPEETILWNALRKKQCCKQQFRRQVPIGQYIVDFLHRKQRLIIEIDGSIHKNQKEYDAEREEYLTDRYYTVIRFTNDEVLQDLPNVLSKIAKALNKEVPTP